MGVVSVSEPAPASDARCRYTYTPRRMRTGILASLLQTLPFFGVLRDDERLRIAERFRLTRLYAGAARVLAAGAPELLIVVDGQADLAVEGGATLPLFAGDMLGEL